MTFLTSSLSILSPFSRSSMCGRNVMKKHFKKPLPETLAPTERQTIRGPQRELIHSQQARHIDGGNWLKEKATVSHQWPSLKGVLHNVSVCLGGI